jgi:hypothetical protein
MSCKIVIQGIRYTSFSTAAAIGGNSMILNFSPIFNNHLLKWLAVVKANIFESDFPRNTKSDSKVAVILFTGNNSNTLFSTLGRFHKALEPSWKIQVFYENISVSSLLETTVKLSNYRSRQFVLSFAGTSIRSVESMSFYMIMNTSFWESVAGEKILIFQSDSALCSKSSYKLESFLQYDYVGAPWATNILSEPGLPISKLDRATRYDLFEGGNGGLSLRSKSSMIECSIAATSGKLHYRYGLHEDIWFSYCLRFFLKDKMLPNFTVESNFAIESTFEGLKPSFCPVGIHKPWIYNHNRQKWNDLQRVCHEGKEAEDFFKIR